MKPDHSAMVLPYATPPQAENTSRDIARRVGLWTLLCSVSAAPSFVWAAQSFDRLAMVVGVMLFIALYTLTTSTRAFLRFRDKPFVRRTLYIGYTTRVVISIFFPLGMAADLIPGLISVSLVGYLLPGPFVGYGPGAERSFVATLLITIVQGTLVNFVLSIFMAIVWSVQALICTWPQREVRGFPIEPELTNDSDKTRQ